MELFSIRIQRTFQLVSTLRVNIVDITHNNTSKNTIHHPFDSLPHKTNHNFYIAM